VGPWPSGCIQSLQIDDRRHPQRPRGQKPTVCLACRDCQHGRQFPAERGHARDSVEAFGIAFEYLRIFTNPWIDGGVVLLIVWFASQLSLLSWGDLSYVLPITAGSYVLTAVLGKIFLHEFISLARWSGICVISAGVMLVVGTCPRGKLSPREIIP
jgi:hypothetical protein